jgi:hypothetical protein
MEGSILFYFTPKGETVNRFPMFGPVKKSLRGRRFLSDEEVIGEMQNQLQMQPPPIKIVFLFDGIKRLVKRWNRCVEVEGDYVEKWY